MSNLVKEETAVSGTSTHLNQVYLLGSNITSVVYNGTMDVTEGQPTEGYPKASTSSGGWVIDFTCGRQSNAGVAQSFVNICGGSSSNLFGINADFDSTPDNLNFYFGLDVTFSGQSAPVTIYLGQGHIFLTGANNWWIGGTTVNNKDGSVSLTLPDGSQVSIDSAGNNYTFKLG